MRPTCVGCHARCACCVTILALLHLCKAPAEPWCAATVSCGCSVLFKLARTQFKLVKRVCCRQCRLAHSPQNAWGNCTCSCHIADTSCCPVWVTVLASNCRCHTVDINCCRHQLERFADYVPNSICGFLSIQMIMWCGSNSLVTSMQEFVHLLNLRQRRLEAARRTTTRVLYCGPEFTMCTWHAVATLLPHSTPLHTSLGQTLGSWTPSAK